MGIRNTGKRTFSLLEEYNTTTGEPTGRTKPNLPEDPDYIPAKIDYENCSVDLISYKLSKLKLVVKNSGEEFIFFKKIIAKIDNNQLPLYNKEFAKGPSLMEEGEEIDWLGDFLQLEFEIAENNSFQNRLNADIIFVSKDNDIILKNISFLNTDRVIINDIPLPVLNKTGENGLIEIVLKSTTTSTTTTTTTSTTTTTTTSTTTTTTRKLSEIISKPSIEIAINQGECRELSSSNSFGSIRCIYEGFINMKKIIPVLENDLEIVDYRVENIRSINPNQRSEVALKIDGLDLSENINININPFASIKWYKSNEEDNSSETNIQCDLFYRDSDGNKYHSILLIYPKSFTQYVEGEGYCELND